MKPGKTYDYPRGKLNASDEGGLVISIRATDKTVIVDFGTPVAWIGLGKEDAMALGNGLIERAKTL